MANARIVIGANYGDEGKGTVVAHYTKNSDNVLNVLTNGGAQRAHSILTKDGSMTFQHFGSGTYHGADSFYSRFFILNPMQFVKEYDTLLVKPKTIYRDESCRWSTPYDSMANLITKKTYNTCGMGIWNTIKRYNVSRLDMKFDTFMGLDEPSKLHYLDRIKAYYEKDIYIPSEWKDVWNSDILKRHFIMDCTFMFEKTKVSSLPSLKYDNFIFENGQGLLLCDTGKDTEDTTPSNTGIRYSLELLGEMDGITNITAHYVTRPYLTRHGDGEMEDHTYRKNLSSNVSEDRTNHFNEFQGEFRYGKLDIESLMERIRQDAQDIRFEVDVTHCDEMDRVDEFNAFFGKVNTYDSPLV